MRQFFLALLLSSIFLTAPTVFASALTCAEDSIGAKAKLAQLPMRKLSDVKTLRVMSFNVLNLFVRSAAIAKPAHIEKAKDPNKIEAKTPEELKALADVILDADPDILTLVEVDNLAALNKLNEDYLGGRYRTFLIDGNDGRGIDIGFMVKADLPIDIEMQTHKDTPWEGHTNPQTGETQKLFSRDVPALLIRAQGESHDVPPRLIVLGNHAKSMQDRDGDPQSTKLRTDQYIAIGTIIDGYREKFGEKVPILLDGDFNAKFGDGQTPDAPELASVLERLGNPFDEKNVPYKDRMSHSFPKKKGELGSQLDNILVSEGLLKRILKIFVYRYKDSSGNPKPIPGSFEQRDQNPSDHFPVILEITTEDLFPEAHQ